MNFLNFIIFNLFLLIFNLNSYNCVLKENISLGEYLSGKIIAMEQLINKADIKPREEMHVTCTPDGLLNCSVLVNPKIIQTENFVFLLSGIELSRIEIMENGEKKLSYIGSLDGIDDVTDIQDVHAGEWQSYIVVLVILSNRFKIYVTKLESNEYYLKPRERIRINTKPYIKFLTNYHDPHNTDLSFILVNKLNDDLGEIIQYKWRLTHFTSDFRLTLQRIDDTHIYQDYDSTIIVITNYKQNYIEIYNSNNSSLSYFKKVQKIMLNDRANDAKINYYSLNYNEHYFLLCYNTMYSLCKLYKYNNNTELFINIKKLPYNYQKLNKLYYNYNFANFLITTNVHNNKLVIFNNYNLFKYNVVDCSNINDIRDIIIYNNMNKIVLIILNGENTINFINIQIDKIHNHNDKSRNDDDQGDKTLLLKTINCFKQLNSLILEKQAVIDEINLKRPNVLQTNKNHKIKKINGGNLYLKNGKVSRIQINQQMKINLSQLFERVVKINNTDITRVRVKRSHKVKNLIVKSLNKTDLLLKNTNNLIRNSVFIKNNLLLDKQFYINNSHVNGIDLTNLYLKNDSGATKINDLKVFPNLIVNSMTVKHLNNMSADNLFSGPKDNFNSTTIIGNYSVDSLTVENLNGVNWNEYYRNVYQRDANRAIRGNLTFTTPFAVKNLKVSKLNNIPVSNYLNKITDQTINANIFINKFYANNINTNSINDIEFNRNKLFLINNSVIINSELLVPNLTIRNNLFLSPKDSTGRLNSYHSTSDDLTQIYNKNIKIRGNLFINKLYLENLNYSKIIVNNQEFNIKTVKSEYWLKNTKQKISKIIFSNDVITNQLFIENQLNNYDINKYCLNNFDHNPNYITNFEFDELLVEGNIHLNNGLNRPFILDEIVSNNIVLNGDANKIIKILDRKQINNLIVNKIQVNRINNYEIKNFVLNQTNLKIHTLKISKLNYLNNKKIFVRNKLFINSYRDFFKNTIYINKNTKIDEINFKNNLKINKLYCNDFRLNQMYNNSVNYDLDNLKIVINGDALFKYSLDVKSLNNVADVQTYLNLLVFKNERDLQIGGKKIFLDRVIVKHNLIAERRINEININYLLHNLFLTNTEQTIQPTWWFNNVTAGFLETRFVNDINPNLFLQRSYFDSDHVIVINSNIIVNNLTAVKGIYGKTKLNFYNIINTLHNPIRGDWRFIRINRNLYYPRSNYSTTLSSLMYGSVVRNKNQIISNEVIFMESVVIKKLTFNNLINGWINLTSIIGDSLVRNVASADANVKIYGRKYFEYTFIVKQNYINRNDFDCNYINNINIVEFNSAITGCDRITNLKQFTNYLKINKLFVDDVLYPSGRNINDMVVIDGAKFNNIILNLNDFEIKNNLNFVKINNFNISDFLENRIRLDSNEVQHINNLNIDGDLIISSVCNITTINTINMSDVVYRNEPNTITGKKTILNNLIFNTSINVNHINNIDIKAIHNRTVFLNQPTTIREIIVPEIIVQSGVLLVNEDQIVLPSQTNDLYTNDIKLNISELSRNLEALKSREYYKKLNYFDYTKQIDIIYSDDVNSRNNMLIDSYDDGLYCNRDENCVCPFQYAINIKNSNKILIGKNNYFDRVFNMANSFINVTIGTKYVTNCHNHYNFTGITTIELVNNLSNDKKLYHYNRIVKNVKLFESGRSVSEMNSFMVVLYTNYNNYNNTVNLLKITNNNFDDIQLKQNSIIYGNDVDINLFDWDIGVILIITSTYSIQFYNSGFVELYSFNKNEQHFDLMHTFIGDYDLINGAARPDDNCYMILLAKSNKNYINVYKMNDGGSEMKFGMYQKIMFEAKIKTITTFEHLDNILFSVTMENDHYHIYIYNHIEGWIVHSTGYYNKVEQIEPFKIQNKDYLYVSGRLAPTAIAVYTQGN